MTWNGYFRRGLMAWLAVLFLGPGQALAQNVAPAQPEPEDPVVVSCLASFDASQALRRENRLLGAKRELVACSQQSCPAVITVKCQQWLEEVKASIPSVVVTAVDGGKDIFDVTVFIDDSNMLEALDGTALELDIGVRKIRAVREDQTRERTVLISKGAKNRIIEFDFTPPKPPASPARWVPLPGPAPFDNVSGPGFSLPLLSWLGFGFGLVGVIVGSITGGLAFDRVAELDSQCTGGVCDAHLEGQFAPVAALNHASTVSFALGGAGIALGVVGLLVGEDDDDSCQVTSIGISTSF